jgi:DMSO reductase anchor subunit
MAVIGLMIGRRLFFAEARHAVTLYYGADAA